MKPKIVAVTLALLGVAVIGAAGKFTPRVEAAGAAPQAFVAEVCWQAVSFPDVIRLALNTSGTGLQANGRLTTTDYSVPLDGAGSGDVIDGGLEITLTGDDSLDGPEYGYGPGQAVFTFHMKIGAGGNGTLEISRASELVSGSALTFLGSCPTGSATAANPPMLTR